MGVPKKRTSKMRRDRRRAANSNLRVAVQVIQCPKCREPVMPHRVCAHCGYYQGRDAIHSIASFPSVVGAPRMSYLPSEKKCPRSFKSTYA